MVAGLAGAGLLDRYVTSATPSVGGVLGRIARGPGPIGSSVRAVLGRRPDPPGVSAERIRHRAVWLDVGAALSLKMPSPRLAKPTSARALARRDRRFDRALAREMSDRDAAVIGAVGGSLITFERAQQQAVTSFLDFDRSLRRGAAHREGGGGSSARVRRDAPARDLPRRLIQRVDRELALADFIFVFSSFHERSFRKAGIPEEKLVLTPLGVDVELFSPRPRGDHGMFRVLFVGQIGQQKGLSYLLDGFEAAALPDAELLLAGVRLDALPADHVQEGQADHLQVEPDRPVGQVRVVHLHHLETGMRHEPATCHGPVSPGRASFRRPGEAINASSSGGRGRGPTRLMVPERTWKNWGSSSSEVARM